MKVNKKLNAVVTSLLMALTLFTNSPISANAAGPVITPAAVGTTSTNITRSAFNINLGEYETITVTVQGYGTNTPTIGNLTLWDTVTAPNGDTSTSTLTLTDCVTDTGLTTLTCVYVSNLFNAGTHDLYAHYNGGDGGNNPSDGSQAFTVNPVSSSVAINWETSTDHWGHWETFTIDVTLTPSGTPDKAKLHTYIKYPDQTESTTVSSNDLVCGTFGPTNVGPAIVTPDLTCTYTVWISRDHIGDVWAYTQYVDGTNVTNSNQAEDLLVITKRQTVTTLDLNYSPSNYGELKTIGAAVYYSDDNSNPASPLEAVESGTVIFTSSAINNLDSGNSQELGTCDIDGTTPDPGSGNFYNRNDCFLTSRQFGVAADNNGNETVTAAFQGNAYYFASEVTQEHTITPNDPTVTVTDPNPLNISHISDHPDFGLNCPTGANSVGCGGAFQTIYGDLHQLDVVVENSHDAITGQNEDNGAVGTLSEAAWFQPEGTVTVVYSVDDKNSPNPTGDTLEYTCTLTVYVGYSMCPIYVHPSLIAGNHDMTVSFKAVENTVGYDGSFVGAVSPAFFYNDNLDNLYSVDVFRATTNTSITSVNPVSPTTYPEAFTVNVAIDGRQTDVIDTQQASILAAFTFNTETFTVTSPGTLSLHYGVLAPTSVDGTPLHISGLDVASNWLQDPNGYICASIVLNETSTATCAIEAPFNTVVPSDSHTVYTVSLGGTPYTIAAVYPGDMNYLPSTSASQSHAVLKARPSVSIVTDADANTTYGDTVTITVTVLGVTNGESVTIGNGVRVSDISAQPYGALASTPCVFTGYTDSNGQSGFTCEIQTNRLHSSVLLGTQRELKAEYLGDALYYAGDTATVGLDIKQIAGVFKPGSVSVTYGSTPVIPMSFMKPGSDIEHPWVLGENEVRALGDPTTPSNRFTFPTCIAQGYMSVVNANNQYVIDCDPTTNGQDNLAATAYAWDYSFTYETALLTTTAVRSSEFIINANCFPILCGTGVQNVNINYGKVVSLDSFYSFQLGNPGTAPKGTVYFYDNHESTTVANLVAPDSGAQPGAIGTCRIDKTTGFTNLNGSFFLNDCYIEGGFNAGVHNLFAYFLSDNANYLSRWTSNRVVLTVAKNDPNVVFDIAATAINPGETFTAITTVSRLLDDTIAADTAFVINYDERVAPTGTVKIYRGAPAGTTPTASPSNQVGTCTLVSLAPGVNSNYGNTNLCNADINTSTAGMTATSTPYKLFAVYQGDNNHIAKDSNPDTVTVNTQPVSMTLQLGRTTGHVGETNTVLVTVTGTNGYSLAGVAIAVQTINAATTAAYQGPVSETCTPVLVGNTASCTITFNLNETGTVTFSAQATGLSTPYPSSVNATNVFLTVLGAYHTVTFDPNGGSVTSGSTTQRDYQTANLVGPAVSRTDYTFGGWLTDAADSTTVITSFGFTMDKTVYAKWTLTPTPPPPPPVTPGVVTRVTPVLSWSNPAAITTTTPLSGTQLNAVVTTPAGLAGTYSYSPAAGTLLPAGTQTLSVTFTPTDSVNYTTASTTVSIVVTAAELPATVSVSGLSAIYNGSSHPVSATTSPAGLTVSITYNGSSSAPVNAGTYSVVATITSTGYKGSANATLTISQATPVITWNNPASVPAGSALSGAQLNATANVPGTFDYSPAAGSSVSQGSNTLDVTFTPSDSTNYSSATASVDLIGVAANLAVTFNPNSSVISAPQLKSISKLVAVPGAKITITGYVQPSKNKATDLRLSLARANAAKAQLLKLYPNANITVVAKGSTINKACSASQNRCVLISVK